MKELIKNITRKLSIFFYSYLFPSWEEGYLHVVQQKFEKAIEYAAAGLKLKDLPDFSMGRMISIGEEVSIGKGVSLQSEGGIIMGDGLLLEDGCVIESVDKGKKDGLPLDHPYRMLPVVIHQHVQVGRNAIIPAGSVVPEGTVIPSGKRFDPADLSSYSIQSKRGEKHAGDRSTAKEKGEGMFFVVSTGRSGTKTIAQVLSKHSDIHCLHEAQFPLNTLSTLHAQQLWEEEKVKAALQVLYTESRVVPGKKGIYGESDLKNSTLIHLLHEVLPRAKFIWLTRRAEGFVASAYGRGWFDDREYAYKGKIQFSRDSSITEKDMNPYRWEYARHRIDGGMADPQLSPSQWEEMSAFERNCWYWGFWNQMIEKQLIALPRMQWFHLRLEEMEEQLPTLLEWLGTGKQQLQLAIYNQAQHKTVPADSWDTEQKRIFDHWCQSGMEKWYPAQSKARNEQ